MQGILETWWLTLGVLIVVRFFEGGLAAKSLAASANYLGQFCAPLFILLLMRTAAPRAVAFVLMACAAALVLAGVMPTLAGFLCFFVLAGALNDQQWPFLTAIYAKNYPAEERGKRVAFVLLASMSCGALFAYGSGHLLDEGIGHYRILLFVSAMAAMAAALVFIQVPSGEAESTGACARVSPLQAFRSLKGNHAFLALLVSWMLLGTGNTMLLPLRIDFLADPAYGYAFSASTIAFYCATLPMLCRIISMPLWGWLYDRCSFITLRNAVILLFASGLFLFFEGYFALGGIATGLGMGGGFLLWSLWVTRYVPEDAVPAAMSLNAFLTGFRGSLAPWFGFWVAGSFGISYAIAFGIGGLMLAMLVNPAGIKAK